MRSDSGLRADDGPLVSARREPSGLRKAAIFLLALDEDVASDLLRSLEDDELERVTAEIARLGVVEQSVLSRVLSEFRDLFEAQGVLREGGTEQAIRLVERSVPRERSRRLVQILESSKAELPFAFLSRASTESLAAYLSMESAQTVALVLAHMIPSKAAEVLDRMSPDRREDIVQRVASLEGPHDEVLSIIEMHLREFVDSHRVVSTPVHRGGIDTAAEILRATEQNGRDVLRRMRGARPELVDDIYRRLFVFEDVAKLDPRALRRVLDEIDWTLLAKSLKTASPTLEESFLRAMNERESSLLRQEIQRLGPVRVGDVESARGEIVARVLELEERGDIYIEGRGAREDRLLY